MKLLQHLIKINFQKNKNSYSFSMVYQELQQGLMILPWLVNTSGSC